MKKSRLLGAMCACLSGVGMISSADAALVGRMPANEGGTDYQAYYDDLLDATWLQQGYVVPPVQLLTWQEAMDWADSLDTLVLADWRLPSMDKNGDGNVEFCATGQQCLDNEYWHMYYFNGATGDNPDPFQLSIWNNPTDTYLTKWSSTTSTNPGYADFALGVNFRGGWSGQYGKSSEYSAWAITDGDPFAQVPLPAAVWLFGIGLLELVWVAKRKAS